MFTVYVYTYRVSPSQRSLLHPMRDSLLCIWYVPHNPGTDTGNRSPQRQTHHTEFHGWSFLWPPLTTGSEAKLRPRCQPCTFNPEPQVIVKPTAQKLQYP